MPTIKKPARARPLEADIQRAILHTLNALPDCRIERNNKWEGYVVADNGDRRYVVAGLPDGSADAIGRVMVSVKIRPVAETHPLYDAELASGWIQIARAFYLEFKRPGERQLPSQIEWMGKVHFMKAFYAVVTSVDEALAAVERCRRGEIQ